MTKKTPQNRLDKTKVSISSLHEPSDEKAYWAAKTPEERLAALEIMRQMVYGYDPETARMEKVLEIVNRKEAP